MLASSVSFEMDGQEPKPPVIEAKDTRVCATFDTWGQARFGKGGYSLVTRFDFTVFEVTRYSARCSKQPSRFRVGDRVR